MTCPSCGKRSVYLKLSREDAYKCRTTDCNWYAFCDGNDPQDVEARAALEALNPGHDMAPQVGGRTYGGED